MTLLRQEETMSLTSSSRCSWSLGCINASMEGLRAQLSFFHSGCPTLDKHILNSSNLWRSMTDFVCYNLELSAKILAPLLCPSFTSHGCFCCRMTWTLFYNGVLLWLSFWSMEVWLLKGPYNLTISSRIFWLFLLQNDMNPFLEWFPVLTIILVYGGMAS